ncbi:MAG: type II secretion system protein GspM [Thermodesulfobacteriota bacterium]
MSAWRRLLARYRGRPLLYGVAILLVFLNLGRYAYDFYQSQLAELETKEAQLARQQNVVRQLPDLRNRVARLEEERQVLSRYLFHGASEEAVSSMAQIRLQEMVVKTGLEPEYIKPLKQTTTAKERPFQTLAVKLRLNGPLPAFLDLLAELYRSEVLFRVDSFSVKPIKKEQLRFFLDLESYFVTAPDAAPALDPAPEAGPTPPAPAETP